MAGSLGIPLLLARVLPRMASGSGGTAGRGAKQFPYAQRVIPSAVGSVRRVAAEYIGGATSAAAVAGGEPVPPCPPPPLSLG